MRAGRRSALLLRSSARRRRSSRRPGRQASAGSVPAIPWRSTDGLRRCRNRCRRSETYGCQEVEPDLDMPPIVGVLQERRGKAEQDGSEDGSGRQAKRQPGPPRLDRTRPRLDGCRRLVHIYSRPLHCRALALHCRSVAVSRRWQWRPPSKAARSKGYCHAGFGAASLRLPMPVDMPQAPMRRRSPRSSTQMRAGRMPPWSADRQPGRMSQPDQTADARADLHFGSGIEPRGALSSCRPASSACATPSRARRACRAAAAGRGRSGPCPPAPCRPCA